VIHVNVINLFQKNFVNFVITWIVKFEEVLLVPVV